MQFRDSFHIGPEHIQSAQSKFKVSIKDSTDNLPDRLLVKVPGTHGGFVNNNGFFYRPEGMKIGYLTWTNPYNRPVVLQHNDFADPIGRVLKAVFVEDNPMDYVNRFGRTTNIPKCHTDLYLNIVDKAAIEKIMIGTYLTVSTAGECSDVRCSICDQNIAQDGLCEHARNKVYESKLAYWKFGAINYKEVSIVNLPADEFAIMEPLEGEHIQDSSCVTPMPYELSSGLEFSISTKDSAEGEMDEKNPNLEGIEFTAEDLEMIKTVFEEVENFLKDALNEEDAALTTGQRKAMPASTFCGPERSFPVPDCLHYRVAKTYLHRYKGAGDKNKILACIERKGKALGCGKYKKGADSQGDVFILDELLKDMVQKQEFDDVQQKLAQADQIKVDLTAQVSSLNDKVKILTDESAITAKKVSDSEVEKKNLLVQSIEDIKILLGDDKIMTSEDPKATYQEIIDELAKRSVDSLSDTLKDLRGRFFAKTLTPVIDPLADKTKDGVDDKGKVKEFKDNKDALNFIIFKRRSS